MLRVTHRGWYVFHMDNNVELAVLALSAEIRAEIAAQRTSARATAEKAGIPYVTLQRYIAGSREWPMSAVISVTGALGLNAGELLDRVQARYDRLSDGETTVDAEETKSAYDLAAKRGRKKNETPHAE